MNGPRTAANNSLLVDAAVARIPLSSNRKTSISLTPPPNGGCALPRPPTPAFLEDHPHGGPSGNSGGAVTTSAAAASICQPLTCTTVTPGKAGAARNVAGAAPTRALDAPSTRPAGNQSTRPVVSTTATTGGPRAGRA